MAPKVAKAPAAGQKAVKKVLSKAKVVKGNSKVDKENAENASSNVKMAPKKAVKKTAPKAEKAAKASKAKAAAKKAPAKTSPAKKTSPKKAPVKKAPVKKAPTAKKSSPAKKPSVRKAGQVKKAAPKKAAPKKTRAPAGAAKVEDASQVMKDLKCFVINMDRRPDRMEKVSKLVDSQLPWLSYERFRASDGKNDNIPLTQIDEKWNTAANSNYGEYDHPRFSNPGVWYKMSPGERGCAHSHYRLWEIAAKAKGMTFVLEDDAQIHFDRSAGNGKMNGKVFTDVLKRGIEAMPKECDVLYLGWSGHRAGNYKFHKEETKKAGLPHAVGNLRKVEYVWTTIAYLITPKGAAKLLKASQPMNQPVDNFMAWEAREGRLNSYVIVDDGDAEDDWAGGIVDQDDFFGDSDIPKSDGGATNDDNRLYCFNEEDAVKPAAK